MLRIVVTVFDALMLFFIGAAASNMDKKGIKTSLFVVITLIMNLFCIWG